jgi:hypothetical protein
MDERWVLATPEAMARRSLAFHRERFPLILEDLLALPPTDLLLVEGFGLVPDLVAPLLVAPEQAIWLLPTPAFRRAAIERRGTLWSMPRETSDPARALANRLARDALLTEEIHRLARERGLRVLDVDGRTSLEQTAAQVERWFAPRLAQTQ